MNVCMLHVLFPDQISKKMAPGVFGEAVFTYLASIHIYIYYERHTITTRHLRKDGGGTPKTLPGPSRDGGTLLLG